MDFDASSDCFRVSPDVRSGFGAPGRIATPIIDRATSTRLPAASFLLSDQVVDHIRRRDRDVGHFAGADAADDVVGAQPIDLNRVPGRRLELRHEMQIGLLHRVGGEHLDLGSLGRAGEPGKRDGGGDKAHDCGHAHHPIFLQNTSALYNRAGPP